MDIGMAIFTISSYLPEAPDFPLFVTLIAGNCRMCAPQGEVAVIVSLNSKRKTRKSLNTVTIRAIRLQTIFYKLPVMVICMTVCAPVMFQRVRKPVFMA